MMVEPAVSMAVYFCISHVSPVQQLLNGVPELLGSIAFLEGKVLLLRI